MHFRGTFQARKSMPESAYSWARKPLFLGRQNVQFPWFRGIGPNQAFARNRGSRGTSPNRYSWQLTHPRTTPESAYSWDPGIPGIAVPGRFPGYPQTRPKPLETPQTTENRSLRFWSKPSTKARAAGIPLWSVRLLWGRRIYTAKTSKFLESALSTVWRPPGPIQGPIPGIGVPGQE